MTSQAPSRPTMIRWVVQKALYYSRTGIQLCHYRYASIRSIQDLPHASPTWANQQGYSCQFAQHTEKGTQKSIKSLKFHNGKKGDSQFQVTVTGGLDSDILQHKDALKLAYYNRHTAPEQELNISKMIGKYSHWLHLFDLSPLCVFKCLLKLPNFENA